MRGGGEKRRNCGLANERNDLGWGVPMRKKVYVVAGEMSGDHHGVELMRALREEWGEVEFRGFGGAAMAEFAALEGGVVEDWLEEAAVMGLVEVLKKYGWFKEKFERAVAEIREFRPEVLLLVDYPGFNLRLAKAVRAEGATMKVVHYVAPQVWAWNRKRIPAIVASHDLMICLFPFEVSLWEEAGLRSCCVGHPLVDELEAKRISGEREEGLVGFFPGSREREVAKLFPVMLGAAERVVGRDAEARFVVAAANQKLGSLIVGMVHERRMDGKVEVLTGRSQELMQRVSCGVVASGTATLEAGYYGMPYCLVYQVAWPTFLVARQVVKIPAIGLMNILAGRELVPEFIQGEANEYEVSRWLGLYLRDGAKRAAMSEEMRSVVAKLGEPGVHVRAAREIRKLLNNE